MRGFRLYVLVVVAALVALPAAAEDKFPFRDKPDVTPYQDPNGLVREKPHEGIARGDGNGILCTSELMVLLSPSKANGLAPEDAAAFNALIRSCYALGNAGLLNRNPGGSGGGKESFDDYVGLAAAGALVERVKEVVCQVLDYGEKHHWHFDNLDPGAEPLWSNLARFPGFRAHLYWSAGRPIPLRAKALLELEWAVQISTAANAMDNGGSPRDAILNWLMVAAMPPKDVSKVCEAAKDVWLRHLEKNYGRGGGSKIAKLFTNYLNGDADHPLVKFAKLAGDLPPPPKEGPLDDAMDHLGWGMHWAIEHGETVADYVSVHVPHLPHLGSPRMPEPPHFPESPLAPDRRKPEPPSRPVLRR